MARALDLIHGWPVDGAAAGWRHRTGRSDTEGDTGRVFELASITKILTALAVLVAVEEGTVELDEPAGPPGATVRHLLAHASGLGPDPGAPLSGPGRRRIYSNAGYEALAELVAQRAAMPFDRYLDEAVSEPLGMTSTRLVSSPAHGAVSSVADLLVLATELLAPGTILAASTMDEAITVAFPDLAGVLPGYGRQDPNPWGLGPELRGDKHPHWTPTTASPATFGHFGQTGTMLWCDPDAGTVCVVLTDRTFGPWAVEAWPVLGDAVLAEAMPGPADRSE